MNPANRLGNGEPRLVALTLLVLLMLGLAVNRVLLALALLLCLFVVSCHLSLYWRRSHASGETVRGIKAPRIAERRSG